MAKAASAPEFDALKFIQERLDESSEVLDALLKQFKKKRTPKDMQRANDTIMEFGMLPPNTGDGESGDGDWLLEGSKILTEGPGVPIGLEPPGDPD